MLYGTTERHERIKVQKGLRAYCPLCNTMLRPKCGLIKIWHWAHLSAKDCDSWYEPETAWHLGWKAIFKPQFVEVPYGEHRADISLPYNQIWELQASNLSAEEISSREQFYSKKKKALMWLFNTEKYRHNINLKPEKRYSWFYWKWPHKSLSYCSRVFLDLGEDGIFEVKKLRADVGEGYGTLWLRERFLSMFFRRYLQDFTKGESKRGGALVGNPL